MFLRRLLLLFIGVNALLALVLFLWRPPTRDPKVPESSPAPPSSIEALRLRIAEHHSGEPYTLRLTDGELSATAGYYMTQRSDIPFSNPRVSVSGGQVVLDAVTRGFAVPVPVRVTGTIRAVNGAPAVTVQDVSLGNVPIPAAVRDQIVTEANKSLDFSRYPLPITVESVQLGSGEATIRGAIK